MSVNFITLYVGGIPVQVVEGSQLHFIYAGLGATTQPPTAIPYVRPDPFPQYVHDEEIADLLADAAVPATDPVVAALFANPGSQTSAAARGALPPTTDAAALTSGTLAEGRLPARLAEAELRAALEARIDRAAATAGQLPFLQSDGTLAFASPSSISIANPAKLRYAPPVQSSPTVVTVPTGFYSGTFADNEDVIFNWPATNRNSAFTVTGGRHMRVIGGSVIKSTAGSAIRFTGTTGSVFIEGLNIDMTAINEDAINVSGNTAGPFTKFPDVYLQNLRIVGVNGTSGTVHADIFQPQGSIGNLRVDKLTGRSNYQGFFLSSSFPGSSVELNRVDLAFSDPAAASTTYLLWLLDEASANTPYPVTLNDVWVTPRDGQNLGQAVWPHPTAVDADGVKIGVRSSDGWRSAFWTPRLPVTGRVLAGPPPGGDFVPAGSVGLGYVSPGYNS